MTDLTGITHNNCHPCPLCGTTILKLGRGIDRNGKEIFQIYCDNCGVETPYYFTIEAASIAWHEKRMWYLR